MAKPAKSENEEHGTRLAQKMTEKGALGYHTTAEWISTALSTTKNAGTVRSGSKFDLEATILPSVLVSDAVSFVPLSGSSGIVPPFSVAGFSASCDVVLPE